MPKTTETRPTERERRAPQMTRLSTSRPTWSVPIGNSRPGATYVAKPVSFGPWGASSGASKATPIRTSTTSAPAAPSGCPRTKRRTVPVTAASRVADARVEPRVEQVDRQVQAEEHQRHHEDHRLDRRIVALAHRLDERAPHAGHHEDDLHDHEPAPEPTGPPPDEGDHRQERVAQGVAVDHRALGQALGPRGAHVVLAHHLEHLRAGEPGDRGADVVGLRQRGPAELLEVLEWILGERHELERRQPVEAPHQAI